MVAVITGASRGIGKATAEIFATHGYDLLLCARTESTLLETVEELKTAHPNISIDAKAMDLSVKREVDIFGDWVNNTVDAVDILVNNAGTFEPGSMLNEPDGVLEKMMAVNMYSAYWLTKKIAPRMVARKSGHIFTICSIAALHAYPNGGAYSISKSALLGYTRNLRYELKPHGVKVTAVIPGAVYTDSWAGQVAEERIMQADDVAQTIYAASRLSPQAVMEEIILRPQLGDL